MANTPALALVLIFRIFVKHLTFSHIAGDKQVNKVTKFNPEEASPHNCHQGKIGMQNSGAIGCWVSLKTSFSKSHHIMRRSSYLQRDAFKGRNGLRRTGRVKRRRVSEKEGMWRNRAWSFVSDRALPKMSTDSWHTTSTRNSVAWNADLRYVGQDKTHAHPLNNSNCSRTLIKVAK